MFGTRRTWIPSATWRGFAWGGNPEQDALYLNVTLRRTTVRRSTNTAIEFFMWLSAYRHVRAARLPQSADRSTRLAATGGPSRSRFFRTRIVGYFRGRLQPLFRLEHFRERSRLASAHSLV